MNTVKTNLWKSESPVKADEVFESLPGCLSNMDQYSLDFLGFCNKYPLWLDLLDNVDKEANQTHTCSTSR